jgi:hypothetical protein
MKYKYYKLRSAKTGKYFVEARGWSNQAEGTRYSRKEAHNKILQHINNIYAKGETFNSEEGTLSCIYTEVVEFEEVELDITHPPKELYSDIVEFVNPVDLGKWKKWREAIDGV